MKRLNNPSDSLDLLLDTMCNTFGAIVLIACLVALQVRDQPGSPLTPAAEATSALWERRLAAAQADVAAMRKALEELPAQATAEATTLALEIQQMRDTLAALQGKAAKLNATVKETSAAKARDPGADLQSLKEQERAVQKDIQELQNLVAAEQGQTAHLEQRLADLERQKQKLRENRTMTVRFPKERGITKGSFPIIVRYGKVYPLHLVDQKDNPHLLATPTGKDSTRYEPIPNQGWEMPADKQMLEHLLSRISSLDVYVAYYVFPDSFDAFRDLRDITVKSGLAYGLDVVQPRNTLIFGREGRAPPPQ